MTKSVHLFCVWIVACFVAKATCEDFEFMILHNNDMHGRFEETERNSATCKDSHKNVSCIGGMARTAHEIRRYRQLAAEGKGPPVIFLNAGDIYVGTTWFNLFRWNISAAFLNLLEPDAISLGNHEFDLGISQLVPLIDHLNTPVVAANLDLAQVPSLQGKIKGSVILDVHGHKVGVIGYLTPDTQQISSTGNVIFNNEVDTIRKESEILDQQGVKIIIALGHSGYLMDKTIAEKVPLVDVVIGGHTNTFLWNGAQPDSEEIEDQYPKIIVQSSGKAVPVVQAYAYTKYLGRLNVTFNNNGDLIKWNGQPIFLDPSIPQEQDVLNLLEVYRPKLIEINKETVGKSMVLLQADGNICRYRECNFGNLMADAFVYYVASVSTNIWTNAPIGVVNGGGIRNTINPFDHGGNVTRGELLAAIPFGNQVTTVKLKGSDLVQMLEQGIRGNGETSSGEFLQVSGLKIVYDRSKPAMSRVVDVQVRCGICSVPIYETLKPDKEYTIVTTTFLTDGGDGHTILKHKGFDKMTQDLSDVDVAAWYIGKYSPVYPEQQLRITFSPLGDQRADAGFSLKSNSLLPLVTVLLGLIVNKIR